MSAYTRRKERRKNDPTVQARVSARKKQEAEVNSRRSRTKSTVSGK